MKRLFIALPAESDVGLSLKEVNEYLNNYSSIIKKVSVENYHITLKFLGNATEDIIHKLINDFNKIVIDIPYINFKLLGLGAFPKPEKASVLWAGMKIDKANIDRIWNTIEDFAYDFGFQRENRKFKPHLTLGRIRKNKHAPEKLIEYIKSSRDKLYTESCFKKVVLFESKLTEKGPLYIELASLDLLKN